MSDSESVPPTPPVGPASPAQPAPAAPAPAPAAEKPTITYDEFVKLDLRIARVVEAKPHPNADKLLCLTVDLGGSTRQIIAGIRAYYTPESLVGKQIVVVANLQPRKMRGLESHGMLLAASEKEGEVYKNVVVLTTDKVVPPGSPVS